MGLQAGMNVGLYTPDDVRREQEQHRSDMMSAEQQRAVWQQQVLASQQEAAQKVAELQAAQKRSQDFMNAVKGTPPAPTPGAGPGATGAAQAASAAPGAGTPTPEAAAEAPESPYQQTGEAPMVKWFRKNPVLAQQFANTLATGDGDTQRKILTMYHESPEGTKAMKVDQAMRAAEVIGLPTGSPQWTKYIEEYTLGREPKGTTVSIDQRKQTVWEETDARDIHKLIMSPVRAAGQQAPGEISRYKSMYSSALRAPITGSLSEFRLGLRKLARAVGIDKDPTMEAMWDSITKIKDGKIADYEQLRVQTMNEVMKRISNTKGAISEREMEAFTNSVAGMRNTQLANLMILEAAQATHEGALEREKFFRQYIRKHGSSPDTVQDAAFAWQETLDATEDARTAAVEERRDRMTAMYDPEGAITKLMQHKNNPRAVRGFHEEYGWLPRGFTPDGKFHGQ